MSKMDRLEELHSYTMKQTVTVVETSKSVKQKSKKIKEKEPGVEAPVAAKAKKCKAITEDGKRCVEKASVGGGIFCLAHSLASKLAAEVLGAAAKPAPKKKKLTEAQPIADPNPSGVYMAAIPPVAAPAKKPAKQCQGVTQKGQRCENQVAEGSKTFCNIPHSARIMKAERTPPVPAPPTVVAPIPMKKEAVMNIGHNVVVVQSMPPAILNPNQCEGLTSNGERCRNPVAPGKRKFCNVKHTTRMVAIEAPTVPAPAMKQELVMKKIKAPKAATNVAPLKREYESSSSEDSDDLENYYLAASAPAPAAVAAAAAVPMKQCQGMTAKGERCENRVAPGKVKFCNIQHVGRIVKEASQKPAKKKSKKTVEAAAAPFLLSSPGLQQAMTLAGGYCVLPIGALEATEKQSKQCQGLTMKGERCENQVAAGNRKFCNLKHNFRM